MPGGSASHNHSKNSQPSTLMKERHTEQPEGQMRRVSHGDELPVRSRDDGPGWSEPTWWVRRRSVIETKRPRHTVMSWIACWDRSRAADDRSWQGRDEAPEAKTQLRKQIEEYDQRADVHPEVAPP